jgi:hypothetical protein
MEIENEKASFTRYGIIKPDSNDFNIRNGLLEADEALHCNEGLLSDPTIVDATGVAISLTSVDVLMHSDSTWGGKLYHKTVPANTALALTDDSINYVYVDWNGGNPIYAATTNRDLINNSNAVPVSRIYMSGGSIEYQLDYDYIARGATIRNLDRVMRIRGVYGMERESGLAITETATRVVNIAAGYVWFGLSRKTLAAIAQGGAGVTSELWYHSGGNWTSGVITAYNNTQYDNGTALATLTANRYAVNWIFRNITTSEIDIVLGTGDYTLAQAEASQLPSIPTTIANFYVLCGRIIVQKSSDTAYAIENVSIYSLRAAVTTNHADLSGLTTGDDHTQYLLEANIDDVPVDGVTDAPISSNWAYDHTTAADPHTGYRLESADHTHATTGAQAGQLDHGNAMTAASLTDDDHTQYLLAGGARALTGDWNIGAKAIDLLETLTDGQYSGITCAGVAGATVAFGDLIYLSSTDQRWELADANAIATSGLVQLGIAVSAGNDGNAINILLYGYVCETDWDWNEYLADKNLYVGETAGDMSQYVPLTDAAQVRIVGQVHDDSDTIFFNPSQDTYEVDVVTGAGASVDVADGATDRLATNDTHLFTIVDLNNPVNADGILTSVSFWFNTDATGVIVGVFYGSGASYTCRSYVSIGNVTSGSKQTTAVSLPCKTGDFLGWYCATGAIDYGTAGGTSGCRYKSTNHCVYEGLITGYGTTASGANSIEGSGVTKTNTIVSINGMDIA